MMEKTLDLLEIADKLWEKGDVKNTLNTLNEAYHCFLLLMAMWRFLRKKMIYVF